MENVSENGLKPDVLIVGGGIAGMQAALEVADSGHKFILLKDLLLLADECFS